MGDTTASVKKVAPKMDQAKSFLSGGFAGIATVLAGHPFDTLKVRLQTSNQYSGLADCFKQTIAKDGLRGLYKGMASPLVGVTPMFALSFWSYDVGQQLVYACTPKRSSQKLTMLEYAIAGGFSAIPTTVVTTPMERVKVVLQTQDQDVPGSAAYFVSYEYFHRLLCKDSESLSIGAVLFSGGMAGVAMWSIAIPPDVIKSRIQAAPAGTYKGFLDCAAKIISQEGASALFKGLGPALLRAFPANAAGFLGRAASLEVMHRMW
ncbi:hypothetical protein BDEG_23389 [Batrachochytrium dendrobatidis JEL423]|uniref:Uncharacterized protein n=1 Tax=Batrachochytrium dendrobatidis (strain JEL423) TaxID=403673 RepID=A0A177WJ89_BATDL|nr:hypothetical protein BDEG_23389 [Batrachochytrium dendrobatidis JEL423]